MILFSFKRSTIFLFLFAIGIFTNSCKKNEDNAPLPIENKYRPDNFPKPVYDFSKNTLTDNGFELGRSLFYDGILSRDGTISCGECHRQDFAFTHHLHDISHGIDNKVGTRNAPSLQNLAWGKSFMWDGGIFDLDMFSIAPIENPLEMDEKMGNVLEKLRKTEKYPKLFEKAFGSSQINTSTFLKAISQFLLQLNSANSPYDKYIRKEKGASLTDTEQAGLNLFKQKCSFCHSGELFTDESYRNNGLKITAVNDIGRGRITENTFDNYKFKVPSLRNIEATRPYMHDGRFTNLEQVLDHYSNGMQPTQNLDPIFKQGDAIGISLNESEKIQIIAFLKTLTDREFLTNKKYSPYNN